MFISSTSPTLVDLSRINVESGIFSFEKENGKLYKHEGNKYFVRVGGGYQSFHRKTEARKYYNEDY